MKASHKNTKIEYKWFIVVLAFLMVFVAMGFCNSVKSLFIAPVTRALHIERGLFSINDSVRFIATAVVNIFFGSLINRFGAKKLICAGFACLISSQIIYSLASNVYLFYVGGMLLGVGLSWTTTTMVGAIVNKWCKENKGAIMGGVFAASGLGGSVAIQLVTPVIGSGTFGFRNAYRLSALVLAITLVIIMLFYKDKSADENGKESKTQSKKSHGHDWQGISFERALKMPYFYCTLVCIFITGMVLQSVSGVAAAHMGDSGLNAACVSNVLSVHFLALTLFKFLVGFIYDKTGIRTTVSVCAITAVVVMVLLVFISDSFMGKLFAVLYGLLSAVALPMETIMLPIYAGEFFGQKSFNKILGIFVSVNTAGYALGAPVINFIFDKCGSYNQGFIMCGCLMLVTIIALQFLINKAHHYQKNLSVTER